MISPTTNMITILGPTASGKTKIATGLAYRINGEIISADSRQVYREMNIGTGKDFDDYIVHNKKIPVHLIDIADPGTEFSVYQYQNEFLSAYQKITLSGNVPILCGGTGLYLEAVLKGYKLVDVPVNSQLREHLQGKSLEELVIILSGMRKLHNATDSNDINRVLRAIEIEHYNINNPNLKNDFPKINSRVIGIHMERNLLRQKITQRLKRRFEQGMIDEVKELLGKGISSNQLKNYGLEYKFLTMFLQGELKYNEMFSLLNTAIHQFAKRQMTWFRRMEKNGFKIHWVDGNSGGDKILSTILKIIQQETVFLGNKVPNFTNLY